MFLQVLSTDNPDLDKIKKLMENFDDAVNDYMSFGDPKSCCKKLENLLNHGDLSDHFQEPKEVKSPQKVNNNLSQTALALRLFFATLSSKLSTDINRPLGDELSVPYVLHKRLLKNLVLNLHMAALALELCCTLMADKRSGPNQTQALMYCSTLYFQLQSHLPRLVPLPNRLYSAQCVAVLCLAASNEKCSSTVNMLTDILKADNSTDSLAETMTEEVEKILDAIGALDKKVDAFDKKVDALSKNNDGGVSKMNHSVETTPIEDGSSGVPKTNHIVETTPLKDGDNGVHTMYDNVQTITREGGNDDFYTIDHTLEITPIEDGDVSVHTMHDNVETTTREGGNEIFIRLIIFWRQPILRMEMLVPLQRIIFLVLLYRLSTKKCLYK
ncbi:hypothetical protein ACS0TY_025979 [Phlomoides rotata]